MISNDYKVKHQLASDEGENLKRIVMSSLWKKNTLYYMTINMTSIDFSDT